MDGVADHDLPFGLSQAIRDSLREVFVRFPQVERVLVHGSRATGRFRPQSDIDLAVFAPNMSARDFSALWMALDDLPIIFRLDVSLWQEVTNGNLKQTILDHGIPLYQAAAPSTVPSPAP